MTRRRLLWPDEGPARWTQGERLRAAAAARTARWARERTPDCVQALERPVGLRLEEAPHELVERREVARELRRLGVA